MTFKELFRKWGLNSIKLKVGFAEVVRRHIVGGANRTLISVKLPLRLCRTGTCRRLSAG